MHFGGFQPLTLTDYPERTACIVFTQGCNLRCGYCHNPQLIGPPPSVDTKTPTEEQIMAFLNKRHGLLDGIVVSGGEPTLQPDLLSFLRHVKGLGFLVKLDTNGTNPDILQAALSEGLLDYVAMDVKHDPQRYAEVTNTDIDSGVLLASRDVLRSSHIAYEFRTTVAPEIHDIEAIRHVAQFCGAGAKLVLQGFRPAGVLCPSFRNCLATSMTQLLQFQKIAEGQGCTASITSSSHVVLPHFQHKAGVF